MASNRLLVDRACELDAIETVEGIASKLAEWDREIRREAMELACRAVCWLCADPRYALSGPDEDGDWWHEHTEEKRGLEGCDASAIREAFRPLLEPVTEEE